PLAQLSCFLDRSDTTRAGERECHERIGRTVSDKRRLQRCLLAKVQSYKEIEFHQKTESLVSFGPKTRRSTMTKMKRFVLKFRSLHLNCQMIHTKTFVKFQPQFPQ